MTSINDLIDEVKDATGWQRTPEPVTDSDYKRLIVNAIKTLFIDTGRTFQ